MKTYKDALEARNYLRNNIIDKIDISDFGATVTPKGKKLSDGCSSCKNGSWICIFIGTQCNLRCKFCPQSPESKIKNKGLSVTGGNGKIRSLNDFRQTLDKDERIDGVSFSGGEPFLYLDNIYEWLDVIKNEYHNRDIYTWVYTNGKLVTEDSCKKLREKGINEIRFDLAATNYSDNEVIEKLRYCKEIFDKVAVEVPVPWYTDRLIGVLPKLDEIGVDYLNLHEMLINKYNESRIDFDKNLRYLDGYKYGYFPSIIDTYKIINFIEDNNLNIIYNDCSNINKILQKFGFDYQRYIMQEQKDFKWVDFLKFENVETIISLPKRNNKTLI